MHKDIVKDVEQSTAMKSKFPIMLQHIDMNLFVYKLMKSCCYKLNAGAGQVYLLGGVNHTQHRVNKDQGLMSQSHANADVLA